MGWDWRVRGMFSMFRRKGIYIYILVMADSHCCTAETTTL